ncbi:MAG: metallophosphatase family protein, partial [Nanoarchaeota archaeon]|nr:metallophosphatase family protein [Nanoarchaeota archaeon]
MKIAIIADIHSNLEALKIVLDDIKTRRIKHIICAGDIIGYGPNPNECIELMKNNLVISVRGNHDDQVIKMNNLDWFNDMARDALVWTHKKLSVESAHYLQ